MPPGGAWSDHDMPTVRRSRATAEAKDYKISAFIMGVVNSQAFRCRSVRAGRGRRNAALTAPDSLTYALT
jgi:hypothetical protein